MDKTFGLPPDETFKFATIEFPGATLTTAAGIDDHGQIVGAYVDSTGQSHGYLDTNGSFTTIDVPGATLTVAYGINDRGQIVGDYVDGTGIHGFVDSKGTFTTIDPPGARLTEAFGINDRGQIVGIYSDSMGTHGFVDTKNSFTAIEFPNASNSTIPLGINDHGQIVGLWLEDRGMGGPPPHGLLAHSFLDSNGTFTTLNPPGSTFTEAFGINNRNQIIGVYVDSVGRHGFLDTRGTFTNIPLPVDGSLAESFAPSMGLNNRGQIAGTITDDNGTHGLIARITPDQCHSGVMKPGHDDNLLDQRVHTPQFSPQQTSLQDSVYAAVPADHAAALAPHETSGFAGVDLVQSLSNPASIHAHGGLV